MDKSGSEETGLERPGKLLLEWGGFWGFGKPAGGIVSDSVSFGNAVNGSVCLLIAASAFFELHCGGFLC